MTKTTEKIFKELSNFLEAHDSEINSQADYEHFVQRFMSEYNTDSSKSGTAKNQKPETSDDYLELAENTRSKKKQIELLNKSIELDPNNLDALRFRAELTIKDPLAILEEYRRIIAIGEQNLQKDNLFKECKGDFWLAFETRPYMRTRAGYIDLLVQCGMMRRAVEECLEMLELCTSDNLGIRYTLMHLYAYLEEETPAAKLYKDYAEISTHFSLPYSILLFKLGKLDEATKILENLAQKNKSVKTFFSRIHNNKIFDDSTPNLETYYGELTNSIDEFIGEIENYNFLFENAYTYFEWGHQILKTNK